MKKRQMGKIRREEEECKVGRRDVGGRGVPGDMTSLTTSFWVWILWVEVPVSKLYIL